MREQPGLLYVKLARRLQPDGGEDVVLFEEWEDAASLYAWVGPNLTETRLVPGVRELIDELIVAHYEALADDDQESFAILPAKDSRKVDQVGARADKSDGGTAGPDLRAG